MKGLLTVCAAVLCTVHVNAFLEDILRQMGGDGGGGGGQHFHMGGGGGQQRQMFPKGVQDKPNKVFNWMKGTTWHWNDWQNVKFNADGTFTAPTQDCQQGQCRWSASKKRVYISWGQAGLHKLKAQTMKPEVGNILNGIRSEDGEKCSATFVSRDEGAALDDTDFYEALGLDEEASEKDIKKAYRRLSVQYHPDKNPGNETAKNLFNVVRTANEILGDPDKRVLYDTGGMDSVKEMAKEEQQGGQQDPFAMMFGGGGGQRKNSKKGQDAHVELGVSLEDLYNGGEVAASINRRVVCKVSCALSACGGPTALSDGSF